MKLENSSTSHVIAIRVSDDTREKVEQMAASQGVALGELALRALLRDVERWRARSHRQLRGE